jgi:hypothetical protein
MLLNSKNRLGNEWPLAPVIPTEAPRGLVAPRNPRARSGGIPREFPLPRSFREFSPKCQSQLPAAEHICQRDRLPTCFVHAPWYHRLTGMLERIHGKNSLGQHGQGESLGVSPLRAKDFCRAPRVSRRSGRDDTMRRSSRARRMRRYRLLSSLEKYEPTN